MTVSVCVRNRINLFSYFVYIFLLYISDFIFRFQWVASIILLQNEREIKKREIGKR